MEKDPYRGVVYLFCDHPSLLYILRFCYPYILLLLNVFYYFYIFMHSVFRQRDLCGFSLASLTTKPNTCSCEPIYVN